MRDNQRIAAEFDASVRWHAEHPQGSGSLPREFDATQDIERKPEAKAATLALSGTGSMAPSCLGRAGRV
ncbi:UNVERIFIED_ORG: hypothetical protein M2438_000333 [Methylobacterium sp. SuP10 SLI 274]|uniref:hypothetical protein n=1 Tax=Methylorubrum extorquens TaxID=408 RepID=UPI00209DC4B3|nr:hypothetical protein [Methylorubrum extorquens]MDF9861534.1 hypothetical protein [Methylorubrum pseudosasae]MDH6635158.1 hypothetical protein [Methylobacterium sp. SuP10 SLI 274]MDH6664330.1 hypothetical protein [Methylorubrum zatmanii]MCP1561332.1 hypothetical protein [Methylorubrum extorquens]MDF9789825.1 hypothetical protein [Methylorubrum extorquens]